MHYISIFRSFAAASLLFCISSVAMAQTVGNWDNLLLLRPGTALVVEQDGRKSVKGKLSRASDDSLFLIRDGGEIELERNMVSAVYLTRKTSRAKRAMIGGLAGAGAGVLIGAVTVAATKGDPLIAAGGFLFGLPAGAAIGALTSGSKKGELIYKR